MLGDYVSESGLPILAYSPLMNSLHRTGGAKEGLSRNLVDVDLDTDVRQLILDQWRLLTGFSIGALIFQTQTLAVLGTDSIEPIAQPSASESTAPGRVERILVVLG